MRVFMLDDPLSGYTLSGYKLALYSMKEYRELGGNLHGNFVAAAHPAGFSGAPQPTTAGLLRALYLAYLLTRLYTPSLFRRHYMPPKKRPSPNCLEEEVFSEVG
jgi:hypothetical protein